jgi:hypothetical protein
MHLLNLLDQWALLLWKQRLLRLSDLLHLLVLQHLKQHQLDQSGQLFLHQ